MWERIAGQDKAVAMLRRAASRPVHSYLLTGPPGSGLPDVARCFAAALLCEEGGCGACGVCERVLRARHPDVVEVEPEGSEILVDQASEVIEAAFRTPVEAGRKVIVLHEAERMNVAAANKLLKTFEEPPQRTIFVLLTTAPDELLDTVRSRCQQVGLEAQSVDLVRDALVAGGVDAAAAEQAARLAGGRLDRARRLVGDLADLRAVYVRAPSRIDGTAGAAARVAADLLEAADGAVQAVRRRHEEERETLDGEIEQAGYPDRTASRMRRVLQQRHDRIERRGRQDALADGLTVLESVYRDALVAPAPVLNRDLQIPQLAPDAALGALDAVAEARRAVLEGRVLNWGLLLEHLCLHLPAPAAAGRP